MTLFQMRRLAREHSANPKTCLGRAIFKAAAIAQHVQKRRRTSGKSGEVYHCDGCGFWHIGHPR